MQAIQDFYIAQGAVVTGDVVLASGVNIWYAAVIRGDLARITLGPRVNIQDGCVLHTDHDGGVPAAKESPGAREAGRAIFRFQ